MRVVITGKPTSYSRPRVTKTHTYNPKAREKESAAWEIKTEWNRPLLEGIIELYITFYIKIPTNISRKAQLNLNLKPVMKRPDLDNYIKFILDAAQDIIYKDDSQIYRIHAEKLYSINPRTEMFVKEYHEDIDYTLL